jgi:predicted permease
MKRGVTAARAQPDLSRIAAALAAEYPSTNAGVTVVIRSMLDDYVGDVRRMLWVLLASALLVLTIACANIANLLLARAGARSREVAMRLALGAGRWRVVRQLLTEHLLLAAGGGVLGALLGWWGTTALGPFASRTLPRISEISLDWRVLAFTLAVTACAGLFFGLVPALRGARTDVQPALRESGRGIAQGSRRLRDMLVVVEIALSLALLAGAGLLVRSFTRLADVDPGYDPRGVLTLRLRLPDAAYRDPGRVAVTLDQMLSRIAALPGVQAAALTTGVPFGRDFPEPFALGGRADVPVRQAPVALTQWVTPGYLDALRIAVVAGRGFTMADDARGALVALVDEEFVRVHFDGRPPSAAIGERIRFPQIDDRWRTIVGVVRHVRHGALDEPGRAEAYGPYPQLETGWRTEIGRAMDVTVRSTVDPAALLEAIKAQVRAVDPDVPLSHTHTLTEATSLSIAPRVFNLRLAAAFAVAALLLCLVGVYGVMSYAVSERTREIGVRLALGADPRSMLALVLGRGVRLAAMGAAAGLLLAAAVGRSLEGLLYAVKPGDPATLAAVTVLLFVVSAAGSFLPARRATRVDPLAALRHE